MKNKDTHTDEDKVLQECFDSFIPSSPSRDFTKNTMSSVLQNWSSQPIRTNSKMSFLNKVWIGLSAFMAVALIYVFDVKDSGQDSLVGRAFNVDILNGALNQVMGNTLQIFSQIPMMFYIVSICLLALLFVDKMIQKLVQN